MVERIETAVVKLWGDTVGAVSWIEETRVGIFEYEQEFLKKDIDVSPIHMGLKEARKGDAKFTFPALNKETFWGLPGMLADALPDKFGNSIIEAWLARQGRDSARFSPIERLCYTARYGMGALEFSPSIGDIREAPVPVEISELVNSAQTVMRDRKHLNVSSGGAEKENGDALLDMLRVGTSAGGARPKAVIAINDKGEMLSGQAELLKGYDHWLLKFDGVTDLELRAPKDYGRIEYAYYLMAMSAGIDMTECRLLEENGRAHFMTKRFDRVNGKKMHMQSLCGIAHYDFNVPGAYGYEQAFGVMRQLRLGKAEAAKLYRRMLFNIMARNMDDHTKNIAFLMGKNGKWRLSPAYDVTFAHNPKGHWTNQHQMSVNGRRDHFTMKDLIAVGESISVARPLEIIAEVGDAVDRWREFANMAGVGTEIAKEIGRFHRNEL